MLTDVATCPPDWNAIYSKLIPMAREWASDPECELEARFFKPRNDAMQCAFDMHGFMESCIALLESHQQNMISNSGWNEFQDWYFTHNEMQIRSRSTYNSITLHTDVTSVEKTTVSQFIVHFGQDKPSVRFVLSKERVVPPEMLPRSVYPSRVSIRQRKSYIYTSPKRGPTCSFDCTITFASTNKTLAETLQIRNTVSKYEIEVEMNRAYSTMSSSVTAASLRDKVRDLISRFDANASGQHALSDGRDVG